MQHAAGAAAGAGATTTRTHQQAGYVLRATCSTVAATTETKTQHSLPSPLSLPSLWPSRVCNYQNLSKLTFFSLLLPHAVYLALSPLRWLTNQAYRMAGSLWQGQPARGALWILKCKHGI